MAITFSEAREIMLKHGITPPSEKDEAENSPKARLIFKRDTNRERDEAIIEREIQAIMKARGVSREEAEKVIFNPL